MWPSSTYFILVLLGNCILQYSYGQVLTPPYFNLAQGRRIVATATCGEDVPEPELFCKLVSANAEEDSFVIQGQVCDHCDPKKDDKKHPAEFAVDGRETWWQSPPLSRGMKYNAVNLTIDLGQEFHVAYVIVKMGNSPRPAVWALERSNDNGQTYTPWQYFADNIGECYHYFGNVSTTITADDSVICDTQYTNIVPLEGGEIIVQLVQTRPSANDFFNSTVLQEWTRATNVRFRLLRVKNLLGHYMSLARRDPTTTRRYFYSIKDISIGGRCRCNGHAETCTSVDENDPYKLICDCKDNTCGHNCEMCCPGFEQKKWSQSKTNKKFVCERCNCFGHSDQCKYNETVDQLKLSLDIHGNYEGGGVCQNCQHFTEGINCDKCIHGYHRPKGKYLNETDVCQPCHCDLTFSTGNCEDITGICECKPEYTKPNCDSCSFGHYGYPLCRPCECNLGGTLTEQCNPQNGKCVCKSNFGGDLCRNCSEGYYNFPECKTCDCNAVGSVSNTCNVENGDCKCKSNYGGRTCEQCADGYFGFPSCLYCNCDVKGTLPGVCDKSNGQCLCKPGYGGPRCDQCVANFTGFPDCKPCNCSTKGSASTVCDVNGKCTCLNNYAGKLCDQCSPGNYQYPDCHACECNPVGTIGISCNNDGTCKCKENFDGDKCENCRSGYYNWPICEECNFDPAGVVSTFTGCNSLKPGDLVIKCKHNVEGKICNTCKDLFWNLQPQNVDGCEECSCNRSGTVGRIGSCNSKSGQCICKPSTSARRCDQCLDGWYNLADNNLFGCTDCDCDIGGSISNTCNKVTGQCACLPLIEGRNCKEPINTYYFPTLHQHQFEIEDGRTPAYTPVRYGFDEKVFPGYSWKGYAVFSHLQNETVHPVYINNPSVYRIILRYHHFHPQSITGSVSVVPEHANNNVDNSEQKFQVVFKPTDSPAFVTVAGVLGNNPSPFVLNPDAWIIKIKIEKSVFLDYFVLIPSEYYEGTALVSNITRPCSLDKAELCRLYLYPNISWFDQIKGLGAYINEDNNRSPVREFFDELEEPLGIAKMPKLSNSQPELYLNLRISRPGPYVLVVNYATTANQNTTTIQIQATTQLTSDKGQVTIYPCRYRTLCRQVVSDRDGRVNAFNFTTNNVNLVLRGAGDGIGIDSVAAVPYEVWSLDYVQPKSSCVINDAKCIPFTYLIPPDSERFDFKTGNENRITKTQPSTVIDNGTELVYLDENDAMIDVIGKVPKPGLYTFIVHYYQPDHPDFDSDIIIHNGQFYEAKLRTRHCPSVSGCRSVVKQQSGNTVFQLTENFVFTVKVPAHKSLWAQFVLLIPSSQYTDDMIHELPFDQTKMFISRCGLNHFYLNTSEEGFCKEATFSLTTKYNQQALPCQCDPDGSTSYQCEKFGGQCPCRENIIGRKCDHCRTGHFGFPNCKSCNCSSTAVCDSNTGECICPQNVVGEKCNQCRPYTYGFDPIIGCEECNCHVYGVENDDLQCDLFTGACKCKKNIEGRTCDTCVAGKYLFPYCYHCECDFRGTTEEICNQTNAACFCKSNVQGLACDVCKDGTFNLQPDDPAGCTKCFCFGKTSRCSSSTLFTSTITTYEKWTIAILDITKSNSFKALSTLVEETNGGVLLNMAFILDDGITYFVAPELFLGNKLVAYGGFLNYTIHYTTSRDANAVASPDVVLYGANIYLYYTSLAQPTADSYFPVSVKMVESNFQTSAGDKVRREDLMQVLQNLTAIYIKASYVEKGDITKLLSVSFEVAIPEYSPSSGVALNVEQCSCPPNYVGLSCEECADGYYRVSSGLFGGNCIPCQCNGHASTCDKTTGICIDCKHNTKGDHCEKCETGFYGNATVGAPNDCLICACPMPIPSNNFATGCDISENGDRIICDCVPGYTGDRCDTCAPGYYGHPNTQGEKCIPCECNGNTNASELGSCDPLTGKCLKCLNHTYGDSCERCAPDYYGDAIVAKNCQACDCDKCGTKECDHRTGQCTCNENVVGEKCDKCAENHHGFTTCRGCDPCECAEASISSQCDDFTGHCKCKDGVVGRTCDKCAAGYWKYSSDGCTSCGCNTGYSIGLGCNATTGLCECLPGVIGDKCDTCPYRSVLIPNDGCFTCNNCTHGLLDVTDEIQSSFQPVFISFQTTAVGYFTAQRLVYINNTAKALALNITDALSYPFDLTPYINKIMAVEKEKETSLRKIQSIVNDVVSSSEKGSSTITNAWEVESLINKVVDKSKMTVFEINSLSYNLETGAVPQIDYAIKEGKSILDQMNNVEVDEEMRSEANATESKARELLSRVYNFGSPMNKTAQNVEIAKKNVDLLQNKLEDLQNLTEKAQKLILDASNNTQLLKKDKLVEKINSLNEGAKEAKELLDATSKLLKSTTETLESDKPKFAELGNNVSNLKTSKDKVSENIDSLVNGINSIRESVFEAKEHADELEKDAKILKSIIKDQVSSEHAVRAANSYKDIISALEAASNAVNEAKQAIESTTDKFQGFDTRVQASSIKSAELLETARKVLEDVQQNLAPELSATLAQQNTASKNANQSLELIENLQKSIDKQKGDSSTQGHLKNLNVDDISAKAVTTLNDIKTIVENLPDKLSEAKELYSKLDSTKKFAQQTANHLNQSEIQDPDITNYINKLKSKPAELEQKEQTIKDLLRDLKQKVTITRDLAAKIKVGVSLNQNTILELPVPQALLEQGSSTDLSLYFKTNQPNGLLLYVGNAMGSRRKRDTSKTIRRPKTQDFLALEIENGYLLLTSDLGEKKFASNAVSSKYIADDKWYKVEVQRTGKVVNLTIVEQRDPKSNEIITYAKSYVLPGFSSVLNLDKENSKFFIGGLPAWFEAPNVIKYLTFSGSVEELSVSGVPTGLWDFVKVSANNPQIKASINGVIARDVLLPKSAFTGCRFNGDGYVVLSSRGMSLADESQILFKFKTTSSNGLLFLAFKDNTFLSIELRQGFIYFQFDVGSDLKSFHTPTQYNDDQWHAVAAIRRNNQGSLSIDGAIVRQEKSDTRTGVLHISDNLYIGGYPGDHKVKGVLNDHFDGCIDDFQINGDHVDVLKNNLNSHGIIPGCPDKFTRSVYFEAQSRKYVRWPATNVVPKWSNEFPLDLTLRLKTTAKYGLIAYGIDESYSFYLALRDGGIVFRSGKQEISSGPNVKYNDDRWHSVSVIHGLDALHLIVDDFDVFKSTDAPQSIDIKNISVYFGSVPADVDASAAIERPFAGFVGDATLNGVLINFDKSFDRDKEILKETATVAPGSINLNSPTTGTTTVPTAVLPPTVTAAPGCLPLNPAPDPDLNKESGYRFGTMKNSALTYEFDHLSLKGKVEFSIDVKTVSVDGIIFYVTQPQQKDFIALYLKDSKLFLSFNCASNSATISSEVQINEGEWHTLFFSITQNQGLLKIDETREIKISSVGCNVFNIAAPYYLGGMDAPTMNVAASHLQGFNKPFVGCLKNFFVNGSPYENPTTSTGVIPCSSKVESGTFFPASGGYLKAYENFRVGKEMEIIVSIKPRSINGLIFGVHSKKHYATLQIVEGAINFTVSHGATPFSAIFKPNDTSFFCNGQWHTITAYKAKNIAVVSVNGITLQEGTAFDPQDIKTTQTNHPLYIGGYPTGLIKSPGIEANVQYVGCMKNFKYQNVEVPLSTMTAEGNVMFNVCPTT